MGLKDRVFYHYFPGTLAARAIRRIPRTSGIVLLYHEVLPDDVTLPAWTIVRETEFLLQMRYLRSHFDVVTMDQAKERVAGRTHAARPFAVVTFDDGYRGNLEIVAPIMESMGLPFLVYVATEAIIENRLYWHDQIINLLNVKEDIQISIEREGRREVITIRKHAAGNSRWLGIQRLLSILKLMSPADREAAVKRITSRRSAAPSVLAMLTEEELKLLAGVGSVSIGAHTHRHELLDQLAPEEIIETIRTSNNHILRITGTVPRHFAYPNGNHNQFVSNLVHDSGYETAVTTMRGFWSDKTTMLNIPRLGIGRFTSIGQFMAVTSGWL